MMIEMTPQLAEICGIHAGDGYLRNDGKRIELDISGNLEEADYYDYHVKNLFKKVFNIDVSPHAFLSRRTYGFVIRNREIIKLFHELGFPYGNKSVIVQIPRIILKSDNKLIYARFLRGLFDTDGCVTFKNRKNGKYSEFKRKHNYYPVIYFTSVSWDLIKAISSLLKEFGFVGIRVYSYASKNLNEHIKHRIILSGESNLTKFFELIGSKNPVKISRFRVWQKIGFCPTNTSYFERQDILNDKINPYSMAL